MSLFDALEQFSIDNDTPLPERDRYKSKEKTAPEIQTESKKLTIVAEKQKASNLPEKLSFLRPCHICQGRNFTYGKKGGFFCNTCQPGISGSHAYAAGKERQKTSTVKPTDPLTLSEESTSQICNTRQEEDFFKTGFLWITEHLEKLLATGWTRPELFRRSRHRWCIGNWGLAWMDAWGRDGVAVTIEECGKVAFTYTSGGRAITQAAYPKKACKKQG